jgi:DNA polymerase III beta subunit
MISVESVELNIVLKKMSCVVTKGRLPVTECVRLCNMDGRVMIEANNLAFSYSAPVLGSECREPMDVFIPFAKFFEVVKKLNKMIDIEVCEGHVKISSGGFKGKLFTMPTDEMQFPTFPKVSFDKINGALFSGVLKKMLAFVSNDDSRPALRGVQCLVSGTEMLLHGTNGRVLGKYVLPVMGLTERNVIIPAAAANAITRLFDIDADIMIGTDVTDTGTSYDGSLQIEHAGCVFTSSLVSATYPDTEKVIPDGECTNVTLPKEDLIRALAISGTFSDIHSVTTFLIETDKLRISSKSDSVGNSELELPTTSDPIETSIKMLFSAKMLAEVINTIDGENVQLSIFGEARPMLVKDVAETGYTALIMPLRK